MVKHFISYDILSVKKYDFRFSSSTVYMFTIISGFNDEALSVALDRSKVFDMV